jgi:hypothetical protein
LRVTSILAGSNFEMIFLRMIEVRSTGEL